MNEFFRAVRSLWLTYRSNPCLVSFEGGAIAAVGKFIDDAIASGGHLDLSRAGLHKLAVMAAIGGYTAVRLLKRPTPTSNQ